VRGWLALAAALMLVACRGRSVPVPEPPEVRAQSGVTALTLTAGTVAGGPGRPGMPGIHGIHDAFVFDGRAVPPTIRVSPGDALKIHYVNALPKTARESCALGPCMDMTNLHFHGLAVSPRAPQDDVLDLIAMPGESIDYVVNIPLEHAPGLNWYHTHPHGESHRQVLDGLSGALVVEGIERYVPRVRTMRERVLVLRGVDIEHEPNGAAFRSRVEMKANCGESHDRAQRVLSVNGVVRPQIAIAPGEQQFWRIVNAAADSYADLALDGTAFDIVARDGMPLAYHDPQQPIRRADHVLLSPAGRVEAIVTGPPRGAHAALRSRCVDTGPAGDPNPEMTLADIGSTFAASSEASPSRIQSVNPRPTSYSVVELQTIEAAPPVFVAVFSEDQKGFYINGRKYSTDAEPMVRAKVGGYQHWRIVNDTRELHPMHIHQAHFLAFMENGSRLADPQWLDTVNVPTGGSVDVIMDFTNPVIRGMSVFHCHLLNHEDKGMMAKILFE
jgi:suppressor of ftsI